MLETSAGLAVSAKSKNRPDLMRTALKITIYLVVTAIAVSLGVAASLGVGTGWRAYTVYGGSMQPHFAQGDLIFTSSSNVSSVKPGQIIVFTADWASKKYEQRVVHRVAAVGTVDGVPFAYTRGDANSVDDPQPVNLSSDEASVVRFSVPNGAAWLDLAAAPYMLALIVAGLGIAVTALALTAGLSPLDLRRTAWSRRPIPVEESAPASLNEQP